MKGLRFGVLWVFFCCGMSHGSFASDLQVTLEQQLSALNQALQETSLDPVDTEVPATQADEEFQYFQNIWLRMRLPVGFVVPGFVTLQVVPEVELLFRRTAPEGYRVYHP